MTRVLTLAAVVALAAAPAATAAGPSFSLRPVTYRPAVPATQSYFIFDLRPGRTIRSEVRVTNAGTATGSVLLYPVDATTGQTSGAVYRSRQARRRGVGRWVKLRTARLTLAPGASRIVAFAVTVPRRVSPGQHLGGIVAQDLTLRGGPPTRTRKGGSFRIRIRNLSIVAVQVDLPGKRVSQMSVTGVAPGTTGGYPTLLLALRSAGTIMLKPRGTLRVVDRNGGVVERQRFALDTFLPQTSIRYPLVLRHALQPGTYRAEVTLDYGRGHSARSVRTLQVSRRRSQTWSSSAPQQFGATVTRRGAGTSSTPWIIAAVALAFGLAGVALALRSRRA